MLRFAYDTCGASLHRLDDALDLIAEAGYAGVALTLDVPHVDPFEDDYEMRAHALAGRLAELDLGLVVETGSRFLLDPREMYEPTLLHPSAEGRGRRIDFLRRAIRICRICGGEAVVFSAGRPRRGVSGQDAGVWLLDGLRQVAEQAAEEGVTVALEPGPGHIVGTVDDFSLVNQTLGQMTDAPLRLALNAGHLLVTAERAPPAAVREFADVVGAITLSDMKRGDHRHLPLGEGDMDVTGFLAAVQECGYEGLVSVELPGESTRAHEAVAEALDWLHVNLPSD